MKILDGKNIANDIFDEIKIEVSQLYTSKGQKPHLVAILVGNNGASQTYVNAKDRRKYTEEHYLKSSDEMYKIFEDLPEALENNANFPLRISYRPKNSTPVLPNIPTNKVKNVNDLLAEESLGGLKEKLVEYVFPISEWFE